MIKTRKNRFGEVKSCVKTSITANKPRLVLVRSLRILADDSLTVCNLHKNHRTREKIILMKITCQSTAEKLPLGRTDRRNSRFVKLRKQRKKCWQIKLPTKKSLEKKLRIHTRSGQKTTTTWWSWIYIQHKKKRSNGSFHLAFYSLRISLEASACGYFFSGRFSVFLSAFHTSVLIILVWLFWLLFLDRRNEDVCMCLGLGDVKVVFIAQRRNAFVFGKSLEKNLSD